MTKVREIGAALDFSRGSKLALRWAVDNLADEGDTLYIIHVKPPPGVESDTDSSPIPWEKFHEREMMQKYEVDLDHEVISVLNTVSWKKHVRIFAKIYWGDAGEKLCEAVGDLKLDSLVMGCRGLGITRRALVGSVTNYVSTNATCSVTIVKEQAGISD